MDQQTAEVVVANIGATSAIITALIAAVAALAGGIIGAVIGSRSAQRTTVTKVYFEKKFEEYKNLLDDINDLPEPDEKNYLDVWHKAMDLRGRINMAIILSSPKTAEALRDYATAHVQWCKELHEDPHKTPILSGALNSHWSERDLVDALRKELYELGTKGRVYRR